MELVLSKVARKIVVQTPEHLLMTGSLRAGQSSSSRLVVSRGGMALIKMSSAKARFGLHVLIVRRGRVIICNHLRWGGRRWRAWGFVGLAFAQRPYFLRAPKNQEPAPEGAVRLLRFVGL